MTAQDIWINTVNKLTAKNPSEAANIHFWLDKINLISADRQNGNVIIHLGAPSEHYADFVLNEFHGGIEQSMAEVLGEPCQIRFENKNYSYQTPQVAAPHTPPAQVYTNSFNPLSPPRREDLLGAGLANGTLLPGASSPKGSTYSTAPNYLGPTTLDQNASATRSPYALQPSVDESLVFKNYIVGPSNQYAHAAAVAAADSMTPMYARSKGHYSPLEFNPLFIYGPPAVGKTHLLHAIGNHVKSKFPQAKICLVSAEKFVNEFIYNVQHKSVDQFREKYRYQADVLLIDDIQFIVGKDRSEEEFFHTFNTLHEDRKLIVLTSDKAPKELDGLEERFRTRFEMGRLTDIRPPEIETRIAILKAKAEADDVYLPDDVATFLGTYVKDTARNLHGVLINIQQEASLTGSELTLDLAKKVLQQQIPEEGQDYTVEMVLNAVCKEFHIKHKDIKGVSKAKAYALPRQIAMFLIRKYTNLGVREIAGIFGKRDHTTVVHAAKTIESKLETDITLKQHVDAISEQL